MRTKNAKRLWPVPVTLGVMALAAFLALGLMATTGAQPAAAQDDPCYTIDTTTTGSGDTSGEQMCSVTGNSTTVKFLGNTTPDGANALPTMYRVYYPVSANEDISLYATGTRYLDGVDHDQDDTNDDGVVDDTVGSTNERATRKVTGYYSGDANDQNPPTPRSPTKFVYKLVSLAGALDGASGRQPQSDTIMVSGSAGDKNVVYAFRTTVTLADVTDRPSSSKAQMFPILPSDGTALTITFLGQAVLTAPDGDDDDKKPDERSSLKAYNEEFDTDNPTASRTKADEIGDEPVYITAMIRDIKDNPLGDMDPKGDARVVFTVMYASGSDLRSNPISPRTGDVNEHGVAEIDVDNWNDGDKAVKLTVGAVYHGANGQMLDLGEVAVSRNGPADSITANIYNYDCVDTMADMNMGADRDITNDMIDMEMDGCAMDMRFGEDDMFILDIKVMDELGSMIDDAQTDVDFDDELLSRTMHGTANGDATVTPTVAAMPFYVYMVEDDAMLGMHMLTVKHASEDVDDVELTFYVAGPPAMYMISGPDNIELSGSGMFTVTARDVGEGIPHFGNDNMVEVFIQGLASGNTRGLDMDQLTLSKDDGMGTFTIYAPPGARDGGTIRIFVGTGDMEVSHPVTFGMAAPDAAAPGMPMNVMATADSDSQITLTWDEPSDDGGSPITGYMVERKPSDLCVNDSTDPGCDATMFVAVDPAHTGMARMYVDMGLMADTEYSYRVAAMNAEGAGMWSATVMATPMAQDMMLTSPSGVQAAAVTLFGAMDIQVNWMAGSNAQGQYVALLTEDYTMLVGELVELGPDATSYKFSNVGSGTFGVAVISYRIVDGEIKYGFEFDDIQMVTLP